MVVVIGLAMAILGWWIMTMASAHRHPASAFAPAFMRAAIVAVPVMFLAFGVFVVGLIMLFRERWWLAPLGIVCALEVTRRLTNALASRTR